MISFNLIKIWFRLFIDKDKYLIRIQIQSKLFVSTLNCCHKLYILDTKIQINM